MPKKLPKVVFVRWNEDASNPADHFLSISESAEDQAEMGESFKVGRYVLFETMTVAGTPKITVHANRKP